MTDVHPLLAEYLEAIDRRAAHLPPEERRGLLQAAAAEVPIAPGASESEALTALLRAPAPRDLVPRPGQDWTTLGLLLIGGFLVLAGWFWGVYRLWRSRGWRRRDKLIGTLFWPYGLLGGLMLGLWLSSPVVGAVALLVPLITAGYLARRHYTF